MKGRIAQVINESVDDTIIVARNRPRRNFQVQFAHDLGCGTLDCGVAYAGDIAIQSLPDTFPGLRMYGSVIGGLTLIIAGLYQISPLKYVCLSKCRSPLGFLLNSWQDGYWGAFRMGVHHGAYCLGCCWSLMAVLFVVGTMNLVWMGVLTLIIFMEKILPYGVALGKGTGIGLIGLGLVLVVAPSTLAVG